MTEEVLFRDDKVKCSKGMQVECLTRMMSYVLDRDIRLSVRQAAG